MGRAVRGLWVQAVAILGTGQDSRGEVATEERGVLGKAQTARQEMGPSEVEVLRLMEKHNGYCPLHLQFEKRLDERWLALERDRHEAWQEQRKMNEKAFTCLQEAKSELNGVKLTLAKIGVGIAVLQVALQALWPHMPKIFGGP